MREQVNGSRWVWAVLGAAVGLAGGWCLGLAGAAPPAVAAPAGAGLDTPADLGDLAVLHLGASEWDRFVMVFDSYGADPNVETRLGQSVIGFTAGDPRYLPYFRYLLRLGADPYRADGQGLSAADWAGRCGNDAALALLGAK